MKLIKIETKGFKSFAEKIRLDFNGGVIAVVGPNGSGKSNINDAIKWVLGEQSIKSLRGDTGSDVIFAGSKKLQSSNKAEVSLTFNNDKGNKNSTLPKQVTITRILERGKSSNKYFINNEPARLKDIKEIAMESGIGKSSLAIISQGTISDIAEASPEERRFIFEEAAGVSKYKSRKKEAVRKLDATTEALDKIRAVTKELEKQVAPLKRQADKAKIYLQKKKDLKAVEIGLIAKDLKFYGDVLEKLNIDLEDVILTKGSLNTKIESISKEVDEKSSFKFKLENEVQKLSSDYERFTHQLKEVEIQESKASQERRLIIEGKIKPINTSKITVMEEELQNLSTKLQQYKQWEDKSSQDIVLKKEIIAEKNAQKANIDYDLDNFKIKLMKVKTKLAILEDYKKNKSNLFKGTKTIVENKSIFPGVVGIVADLLNVQSKYKIAIESLLVNALQNVVVKNSETAVKAVKFLNENKGGRATFIPLSVIKPKGMVEEHYAIAQSHQGFLGTAAELVDVKPQYEILKKFLLGNIIVAEEITGASNLAKTLNHKYMIVTLNGDVVRAGGVISGGERQKSRDFLGNEEQMDKLKVALPLIEKEIQDRIQQSSIITNLLIEENAIIAELNIEIAKVREKQEVLNGQFYSLKSTYEAQTQKTFIQSDMDSLKSQHEDFEAQKASTAALLKAKRQSIISQNNDLSLLTIQKTELEKSLRSIIESSSNKINEKNQAEFIIAQSKKRLVEEYEMTPEKAQTFSLNIDEKKARVIVETLRAEIKALGYVNIEAIESFEEVNTRYQKYVTSEKELFEAQQTIVEAINEMDKIIVQRLDKTVKDVNKELNNVFSSMFGGGYAQTRYTNPNNLLETGIEVIAQPPGKTVKNLRLFSGGEKALIAISLLFAVLKSKPLPLCILDEVEAPLDDANVVRFANYLQELKHQTQFLVITHRIGTMSRVDSIFGATMQDRGSTSFFTVKLEEAKELLAEK